jgi:polyisoprenoid-binding protein YceI
METTTTPQTTASPQATTWSLDPAHSEIGFQVKHLMITSVRGKFDKFDIHATCPENDFEKVHVEFTADTASVNTSSEQRDGHLKSADFFDSENHPQMTFKSNGMKKISGDDYEMSGDLTIRGVTKPVKVKVEVAGMVKDPYGQTKAGFIVEGKINRKDFGLLWNATLETGGLMVSDDVKIHADIQMIRKEAEAS